MKSPSRRRPAALTAAVAAALVAGLAVMWAAGCGGSKSPPPQVGWCPLLPGEVEDRGETLTFALTEDVNPANLPFPENDSEAIVFRHFYEGLVDLDCRGEPIPALASEWHSPDLGATWTFELRGDARFADGAPVVAIDVKECWRGSRRRSRGDPARFAVWERLHLRDVSADGRTLRIRLEEPDAQLPYLLASPEFLVSREGGEGWPLGTRGLGVSDLEVDGRRILSGVQAGERSRAHPSVHFVVSAGADARDAFGEETDLAISRDRVALEHLARTRVLRLTPLPWSRVYVFLDPGGGPPAASPLGPFRLELANDVLTTVARPAERVTLDPVDSESAAGGDPEGVPSGGPILFPRGDDDAARLAERIASLRSRDGEIVSVEGVLPPELAARASATGRGASVLRFDRGLPIERHQRRRIQAFAPAEDAPLVPLVKTRAMLVSREEIGGVTFGYDAVPRLDAAGRIEEDWP